MLFPPRCPGCDQVLLPEHRNRGWCNYCASQVLLARVSGTEKNIAVFAYEGVLRDALHRLKYQNRREIARTPGRDAAIVLMRHLKMDARLHPHTCCILVPMPLHRARQRERGYNQAELLARAISDHTGIPVVTALKRIRSTPPLNKMNPEERRKVLEGCMEADEEALTEFILTMRKRGRTGFGEAAKQAGDAGYAERTKQDGDAGFAQITAILVDDIITSGASMDAAAEALRRIGVIHIWSLGIATPRKPS